MDKARVIVFDVNETLSDMSPIGERFTDIGAPAHLAKLWFATLLRDGFALTATGDNVAFADVAAGALRSQLAGAPLTRSMDDAVEHVIGGMSELPLHPDVADAVHALKADGRRMVTLSEGSPSIAEKLFSAAGIADDFEALLSVEDAPAWKPARSAYEYAARTCRLDVADLVLVAVHPWDIHGANRAGLRTVWLNRSGEEYPAYFTPPQTIIENLTDLPQHA